MLDPWCYTPDQIARLTRWQVDNLYLIPAAKQSKELDRTMQGKEPTNEQPYEFQSRDEFIAAMQLHFPGKSAEEWAVDWEVMQDNARGK